MVYNPFKKRQFLNAKILYISKVRFKMAYIENTLKITDDALKIFKQLYNNTHKSIKRGQEVDTRSFASTVRFIGDSFEYQGQKYLMNSKGGNFAESLVNQNRFDLASILYGILIKRDRKSVV